MDLATTVATIWPNVSTLALGALALSGLSFASIIGAFAACE